MGKSGQHQERLRAARSFRPINPFRGKRNTDTRHTAFSLWEDSVWSHCQEKNLPKLVSTFFFTYGSPNYHGVEPSTLSDTATSQARSVICYIKYFKWGTTTGVGPRIPSWQTGWNVMSHIQVKFIESPIHIHIISVSFRKPKGSIKVTRKDET